MRIRFALVSSLLFVFAVLADRRREHRRSRFLNHVDQSVNAASGVVEYSTNWSGAVLDNDTGTFTFVTGKFTIPTPSGQGNCGAAAWVGIDGNTCYGGGLLQAGVDLDVDNNVASYGAWYEWYPDWSYYFDDISVSAGDVIRVNITALSATSGITTVENLSNGQHGFKKLNSTYALCRQNAEWIVEDYEDSNNNLVPFADFHKVTFTEAKAIGPNGTYTPDGAIVIDIQQSDQILTSVSINGSSLTVKYV